MFQLSMTLEAHPAGSQRLQSFGFSGRISDMQVAPTRAVAHPTRDWSYVAWTADVAASQPLYQRRSADGESEDARAIRATVGASVGGGTVNQEDQAFLVALRLGLEGGHVYGARRRWCAAFIGGGVEAAYVGTDDGVMQLTLYLSITVMNTESLFIPVCLRAAKKR